MTAVTRRWGPRRIAAYHLDVRLWKSFAVAILAGTATPFASGQFAEGAPQTCKSTGSSVQETKADSGVEKPAATPPKQRPRPPPAAR